jgi:uncharacterized membrane protein
LSSTRLSLDALTQRNIELITALEHIEAAKRSWAERISDIVTRFGGSITFLYLHVGWFAGWLLWNLSPRIPPALRFDPAPFALLNLLVALEAVMLSTFILMSQRRQDQLADRRNHLDLQINLLSEQENSKMLAMLAVLLRQQGLALDDPEVAALQEATRPETLVQQLEQALEQPPQDEPGTPPPPLQRP